MDERGFLVPHVYDVEIKFGDSYLHHDNFFLGFFMHQIVTYSMVMIEQSSFFVGKYMFSGMLGPLFDQALSNYQMTVNMPSIFRGQHTVSTFTFDYRNTRSPYIGDGFIDIYFLGELNYGIHRDQCQIEADWMDFVNSQTFSQLVISESAASCWMNQWAQSSIGKFDLDEERVNLLFEQNGTIKFSSTSAKEMGIPIFYQKIGGDIPMKIEVHYKDFKVMYGKFDSDIIFEYTACIGFFMNSDLNKKEVLYDEIPMIASLDMTMADDVAFMHILNLKHDTESKYGVKKMPVRNSMDMGEADYREFLSSYGFFLQDFKKWLNNDYLSWGIRFPYNPKEFYTTVSFKEQSMHIMLEVEEDAFQYFEDDWM